MWLRQSTASQEVLLGPFLDSTDGNTAESGLTIANTDIKLWKEGATTEADKNSGGAIHISGGRYYVVLDATDSNTLGKLEINVHVTGALAVRREFMVVPAAVYDALILGTDNLDINVAQWLGTAPATPTVAGVPEVDTTHVSGTIQTANDNGADINAILVDTADMQPRVAAVEVDTSELQGDWANGGRLDLILDIIAADTTTDIPALIAALNDIAATDIVSAGAITTLTGAVVNVDTVDTTTTNTDMRGTEGANTVVPDAAGVAPTAIEIRIEMDSNSVDFNNIITDIADLMGATFNTATDSNEAIRNRGDAAWVTGAGGTPPQLLQSTTIATLASQTSFTLTAGSADDDAYVDAIAIITDSVTSVQKAVGLVSTYTGATKTVVLAADPGIFTMAVGDTIEIIAALGAAGGGATAAQVWAYATRVLTANTNLNDPTAVQIRQEMDSNSVDLNQIVSDVAGLAGAAMRGTDSAALASALATAQTDLDTITGVDGVTLATLQALYAPSKAGDAMTLTVAATSAQLVADVWNEIMSAYSTNNTFGKTLRGIGEGWVAVEGAVNDAGATTTVFITDLTEITTSFYSGQPLVFISGVLKGQARIVTEYNGSTKEITVERALTSAPVDTSQFIILANHTHPAAHLTADIDANSTQLAAIIADTEDMQPRVAAIEVDTGTTLPALIDDLAIKKNTVFSNFEFLMVLTSDHVTPATGLVVTGQRSVDGGAFAAVTGVIAEISNGIYQFDALAADTNGDVITWRFSAATADDTFVTFKTVA